MSRVFFAAALSLATLGLGALSFTTANLLLPTISLAAEFAPPRLSAPVVDEVRLYSDVEREQLSALLLELQKKSQVQMAVLIPASLQGLEIEQYAIKVAEQWKLGETKTDYGLLFILAPNERKLRLEVGYGLEGDIPDARAKQILSDIVRPYLKANKPFLGTAAAIQAVAGIKGVELSGAPQERLRSSESSGKRHPGFLLILFVVFFLLTRFSPLGTLFALGGLGGRRGGGMFGGGGGGGGMFGGGGGGFGGGGASSDW